VAGLALAIFGGVLVLQKHYLLGAVLLAIGRLCDIADGWAAERTGTKSNFGAMLDAGADKLATIFILIVLVAAHILPLLAALLIILVQGIILFPSVIAVIRNIPIRPAVSGKLGMAATWLAVLSYVTGMMFDSIPGAMFRFIGLLMVIVALVLSSHAATTYFKDYLADKA
jgi:cardiolipin synthase (CMP-forming)